MGCAHTQPPQPAPLPLPAAAEDVTDGEMDSAPDAVSLLEDAFSLWHEEHYAASVQALHAAIETQNLNDAGQALAYWHIYLAEQALGHSHTAQDALSDFIVVANDMVEHVGAGEHAAPEEGFVNQFDLPGRLARARATQNLAWAQEARAFGRSAKSPVPVFSDAEMHHFLELAPPCAQARDRRVIGQVRSVNPVGHAVAKTTLRCRHAPGDVHYFFEFIGDEAQSVRARQRERAARAEETR